MVNVLNALSIDVEEYFQVEAFAKAVTFSDWSKYPLRVEKNTYEILNLLEKENVKATFFCVAWIADKFPSLIRQIASFGHEIASHGYTHRPVFRLTPEEFRREVRKSKKILEDISGKEVLGFRAPTYSITKKNLWALTILKEEGYRYDSSIFPIRHDLYGFPEAPRYPFLIEDLGLLEFPISTFRFAGINLPVSGGGYFRLFPYALTRYFLSKINISQKPFVFYCHPWEFDPDQPRIKGIPLKSRFRHYFNLNKTKERFERLLKDFSFGPLKIVLENLEGIRSFSLEDLQRGSKDGRD